MEEVITCGIFLVDKNKKVLCVEPFGKRVGEKLSIPKGVYEENEDGIYFNAALRELKEETSFDLSKNLDCFNLISQFGKSPYKGLKKSLISFFVYLDKDLSEFEFKCASFFDLDGKSYPEISNFTWLTLDEAKEQLHYTQSKFIDEIKTYLEWMK